MSAFGAGLYNTCAITTGGGAQCSGDNFYGQIGDGTKTRRFTPVDVSGLSSGLSAIDPSDLHTCAITQGGGVKCWGDNSNGVRGGGTTDDALTAVDVLGLSSGIAAITLGLVHTCALTTSGGVKCWGSNFFGQIGDGSTAERPTVVNVSGLSSGVRAIAAVDSHTCAVMMSGGVKCWGWNSYGQLGDGSTTTRLTAVEVLEERTIFRTGFN